MTAYPRCKECHRQILFARSSNGKMIPLDVNPDPKGNVACYRDVTGAMTAHVVTKDEPALAFERTYMPHFATCPVHLQRLQHQQEAANDVPLAKVIPISRGKEIISEQLSLDAE